MNRYNQGKWSKTQCEMILAFLSFADYFRPRFFLLENVRNFLTFNKGQTFRLTVASLLEMGYQVHGKTQPQPSPLLAITFCISSDNFVELAKLVTSRKRYRSFMDFLTSNYRKSKFMFGDCRFSMLLNEIYCHQLDND